MHLTTLSGEKPYVCSQCGQAFKQKSHLTCHTVTHTNERPYKCTWCDKSFKHKQTLATHLRIHTGKKAYKCSICSFACHKSYGLTKHMEQHSNELPQENEKHDCNYCHRSFPTLPLLNGHMSIIHNIDSTAET